MNFKYYNHTGLIITILIISAGLEFVVKTWIEPFVWNKLTVDGHLLVPTTEAIIGGFFVLYNYYGWKLPVLKWLIKVPNMSGRYQGKIDFVYNGIVDSKECVIEITQTASRINIHSYFSNPANENTESRSFVEEIKKDDDGFFEIYFFYQNSGTKNDGQLDSHEGVNVLRFIPGKKEKRKIVGRKLTGHYFTNRKVQTRGIMEAEFVSKKLKGEFK